jgi:hypothetical protein
MRLLSEANVARRCESCGEAARRSRGGAALRVCPPLLVGDDEPGDEAAGISFPSNVHAGIQLLTFVGFISWLVNDGRMFQAP